MGKENQMLQRQNYSDIVEYKNPEQEKAQNSERLNKNFRVNPHLGLLHLVTVCNYDWGEKVTLSQSSYLQSLQVYKSKERDKAEEFLPR